MSGLHPRRVMHRRDGLADDHVGPDFLERLQSEAPELPCIIFFFSCSFSISQPRPVVSSYSGTHSLCSNRHALSYDLVSFSAVNGREPMEFWRMAGELGVVVQQVASVGLLWLTWLGLQTLPKHDTV